MTTLFDGSVLIALAFPEHDHHIAAGRWYAGLDDAFATCPITQGSLLRFLLRVGSNVATAQTILAQITELPRHVFWPDSVGYLEVRLENLQGHRQVTDAYLAQLARVNHGRLATFDEGLAALHADVADLVPIAG